VGLRHRPGAGLTLGVFGSWLVVWDDLLPEYPSAPAEADAAIVADALVASYGGRRDPAATGSS
jgi:hypothetical protein